MKWLIALVMVALFASASNAYHSGINETTTAAANASCSAAFQSGCTSEDDEDHTDTVASSGFAAPLGSLGGSPIEIALLHLLVAGALAGRLYRSPS